MISPWARAGVGQGFGQGHSRCSGPLRNGRIAVMKMKNLTAAGALLVIGVALTGCGGVIRMGGPHKQEETTYEVATVGYRPGESRTREVAGAQANRHGASVLDAAHWPGRHEP